MPQTDPPINATATVHATVKPSDLASSLHITAEDNYPPVWATPNMIALMEIASARVLAPHLKPDEMSAGAVVNVVHKAPTPLGAEVWATSKYVAREGKLYKFEVEAFDRGGRVGYGTHSRGVGKSGRVADVAKRRCEVKL